MNQNTSVLNIYDALINIISVSTYIPGISKVEFFSLVFSDSTFYHEPPRQEKLYEGKLPVVFIKNRSGSLFEKLVNIFMHTSIATYI